MRTIENNNDLRLIDVLKSYLFKQLIQATRNMAEYNHVERSYKSPSLALQMGTLMKSAINAVYSIEAQKK